MTTLRDWNKEIRRLREKQRKVYCTKEANPKLFGDPFLEQKKTLCLKCISTNIKRFVGHAAETCILRSTSPCEK